MCIVKVKVTENKIDLLGSGRSRCKRRLAMKVIRGTYCEVILEVEPTSIPD